MRKGFFEAQRSLLALFCVTASLAYAGDPAFCPLLAPGTVLAHSFEDPETCPEPCPVNEQIQAVKDAADGKVSLPIHCAYVTHTRPFFGPLDQAGFFLQGYGPTGPAIFARIPPSSLEPPLNTGDVVSLTVTEKSTANGVRQILSISDLVLERTDQPLAPFIQVQDVTDTTDLVSNLDNFESEMVSMTATITGPFGFAGGTFEAATISTAGIAGDPNLVLRIPVAVKDAHAVAQDCDFHLPGSPLFRFNAQAQASAWYEESIELLSCPEPQVLSGSALTSTSVRVNFDRIIEPSSVLGDGSQFTFDNGLTASAAIVDGYSATATTTEQVGGQMYTVTVASTVTDALGAGINIAANSAAFPGYQPPALVRVNEINANLAFGCDLIELRVITGGAMGGISLGERTQTLVTFSNFSLAAGDMIIVHLDTADSRCNSAGSSSETASASEQPSATYPENYDSAYDWYSSVSGISATTNVLTLYDPLLNIMDAVLLTSDAMTAVNADAEARAAEAAAAGEWQMVGGGVPKGGFVGNNYNAHAVLDLDATTDTTSIQRDDDADNNDLSDWTTDLVSWGVINTGQSN